MTFALIDEHRSELAAVIVEPMIGAGGCLPATASFLKMLRSATKERAIILIFDEVMTSRSSGGGLQKRLGIIPDITTLGKYIGGGASFGVGGGAGDQEHLAAQRRLKRPMRFLSGGRIFVNA